MLLSFLYVHTLLHHPSHTCPYLWTHSWSACWAYSRACCGRWRAADSSASCSSALQYMRCDCMGEGGGIRSRQVLGEGCCGIWCDWAWGGRTGIAAVLSPHLSPAFLPLSPDHKRCQYLAAASCQSFEQQCCPLPWPPFPPLTSPLPSPPLPLSPDHRRCQCLAAASCPASQQRCCPLPAPPPTCCQSLWAERKHTERGAWHINHTVLFITQP